MRKEIRVVAAGPPITLAQVKSLGYIQNTARDTELQSFIDAAVIYIEQKTGRSLITQEWDVWYDQVEFFRPLNINQPVDLSTLNANSIDSVTTYDINGNATVVTASDYRLTANRIIFDLEVPFSRSRLIDAVKIEVTAGYAATEATITEDMKTAISVLALHWLENGVYAADSTLNKVPDVLKALLMKYNSTVNWIA